MPRPFDASSTADEVLAGVDLTGKRVLVTGVSAGLGVETARSLVAHGAHVVGAARDLNKAARAAAQAHAAARKGGGFELIALDLASLASVRRCADALLAKADPLDLIIGNAGVMASPFGRTTDGFETQFGTNHLGHFLLVNRIASLLGPGARVVMVSSSGHRHADVDLDDPNFDQTPYQPFVAYGRSKTANILFAVEFDRRHRAEGIRATAIHPGGIATELGRHAFGDAETMQKRIEELIAEQETAGKPTFPLKSLAQGAATSVWAGLVAPAETIGGRYCENCHVALLLQDEIANAIGEGVRPYALDPKRAKALWARSEALVAERF